MTLVVWVRPRVINASDELTTSKLSFGMLNFKSVTTQRQLFFRMVRSWFVCIEQPPSNVGSGRLTVGESLEIVIIVAATQKGKGG